MLDMCTAEELSRPSSMGDRPAHYAVTRLQFPIENGIDYHLFTINWDISCMISIYLSTYLSIYLYTYLSIDLSIYLSIYIYICGQVTPPEPTSLVYIYIYVHTYISSWTWYIIYTYSSICCVYNLYLHMVSAPVTRWLFVRCFAR